MDPNLTPMEIADNLVTLTREKRQHETEVNRLKKEIEHAQTALLQAMEDGKIPTSFRHKSGVAVFLRTETRASAVDHMVVAEILRELGLVELLPKTVNSQTLSAYVREHINEDTGEIEDLDPRLAEAIKITVTPKVIVNS